MYKTQGIWEPLSAWQTGLALNISSARQGQQMCIIPKPYRQPWGALARVKVHYCSLPQLIESLTDIPVYGTFLNRNIIYAESLSAHGLIVMGNEGKGVSLEVEKLINNKLYIPNYPQERETSESLNVAIATAVVCSEFRRRLLP